MDEFRIVKPVYIDAKISTRRTLEEAFDAARSLAQSLDVIIGFDFNDVRCVVTSQSEEAAFMQEYQAVLQARHATVRGIPKEPSDG